jgi:uncharacterized protein (TIGR02271 family)
MARSERLPNRDDERVAAPDTGRDTGQDSSRTETIVPVVAEDLQVGARSVPKGGIRVHKKLEEHVETVDMPLMVEHLDVKRVVIGKDIPSAPAVRREGETLIIPIVEEVLVVEKRLRLKEEIHVTRRRVTERHEERVTVNRERAEIEHVDAEGRPIRVVLPEKPAKTTAPPRPPARTRLGRNKIL